MVRAWSTAVAMGFGGLGCVAIGALLATRLQTPPERVWHDAPSIGTVETIAAVPSFRSVVEKVGPSVVTVRAWLPAGESTAESTAEPNAEPPGAAAEPVADTPDADVRQGDEPQVTGATVRPGTQVAAEPEVGGRRSGSGFVIHEGGLLLTSRHVVVDALSIEVLVPTHGRFHAELVGEDRATDLALLRLTDPPAGLVPLALGGSEELAAGDWIVTVGNPFGFARTVTAGVVSFVGRHLPHSDFGVSNDFLQISAPVNPGSSGCPVLDVHGRVVGVSTQVAAAAQGIAFAVPSRSVVWALAAMERQPDGCVRRGYLGIAFAPRPGVDDDGAPRPGALIVRVADGMPGQVAGLRRGDVVLRVDDAPVREPKDLHERIVRSEPGTPIALQLLRDGLIQDPIVAVLGEVGRGQTVDPAN